MTNPENSIPHPDPAWDYYPLWHSCQHIKAKIEAALKVMQNAEEANGETDEEIREILDVASDKLLGIVNELVPEDNV